MLLLPCMKDYFADPTDILHLNLTFGQFQASDILWDDMTFRIHGSGRRSQDTQLTLRYAAHNHLIRS